MSYSQRVSQELIRYFDQDDAQFIDLAVTVAARVACHLVLRGNAYRELDTQFQMEVDRNFLYMLADELSYDCAIEGEPNDGMETDVQDK